MFEPPTWAKVAPLMAVQVVASADCSMWPSSVPSPPALPTTWIAKHGPSPSAMSTDRPLVVALRSAGYCETNKSAAEARSLIEVAMKESPKEGWISREAPAERGQCHDTSS